MPRADGPTFVIYQDLRDGYRWWLRAAREETLAASEVGYAQKSGRERVLRCLREVEYPGAAVFDSTVRGSERPGRGDQ